MKYGSVDDISARLILWSKRAPKGFARAEFGSEFARKRVVNILRFELTEKDIPFHEIETPRYTSASNVVRDLLEQLAVLESGVVSINGFATAFSDEVSLEDSLQVFNFNRENLARPNLRQIWWMPTFFAERFIRAVPDLNSWFLVRLHLTEVVPSPTETWPPAVQPVRLTANLEDARKRAKDLVDRFGKALEAEVSARELRQNFINPAISALREAGAEKEGQELSSTLNKRLAQRNRPKIFISYSHKDEQWLKRLQVHLKPLEHDGTVERWDDTRIKAGANWQEEIKHAVESSQAAVLLVSADFLASDFIIENELPPILAAAKARGTLILPVIISPCRFDQTASLSQYQAVNPNLKPLTDMTEGEQERLWVKLTKDIEATFKNSSTDQQDHENIQSPEFWNVPDGHNPFFTGRRQTLDELRDLLTSKGRAVLSGLGGIGKTQTAAEYVYRYRHDYRAVLWVKADSRDILLSEFFALAELLNLPEKDIQDQNLSVAAVKRWLETHTDWLLVLDNADDPRGVEDFLPPGLKGHLLLTSRAQVFDNLGIVAPIILGKMSPEEAKQFFLDRTGRSDIELAEVESLEQIAKELDYLPLAMEQAGAYLTHKQCRFQDYLTSYRGRGLELLEKTKAVTGNYPTSVATTWLLNFEQVEQTSPAAAELLRFSAFLNPDKIPLELIASSVRELGPLLSAALADVETNPLSLDELLEPPTQYSLVHRDILSQSYSIHRLVQIVIRHNLNRITQRLWAERTVKAVSRTFPSVEFSTWQLCELLLPQAKACLELVETWRLELPEAANFLNEVGVYLKGRARYSEAELFYRQALEIWEKVLGPDHPYIAISLNNLALLYDTQGRYAEVEPLYQRALEIWKKTQGPEYPDVAQVLNNLGLFHYNQGQYVQAELLFIEALAIWEKTLSSEHSYVATSLNNLAALYSAQGKYAEAEPLYRRALAIREKTLGSEHPDVAQSLNNLATFYQKQSDYDQAEPLYRRALAIREKTLGSEHPDVAQSLNNLGELYNSQSKYPQAQPCFQRALKIWEKLLGSEHPHIATVLHNLASMHGAQGNYIEAESLYHRALAIWTKVLGSDHPHVANSLNSLAGLYRTQRKYTEAESLYLQALATWERVLGPDHQNVAICLGNYAALLRDTNKKDEAAKLEARAQAIRSKNA